MHRRAALRLWHGRRRWMRLSADEWGGRGEDNVRSELLRCQGDGSRRQMTQAWALIAARCFLALGAAGLRHAAAAGGEDGWQEHVHQSCHRVSRLPAAERHKIEPYLRTDSGRAGLSAPWVPRPSRSACPRLQAQSLQSCLRLSLSLVYRLYALDNNARRAGERGDNLERKRRPLTMHAWPSTTPSIHVFAEAAARANISFHAYFNVSA